MTTIINGSSPSITFSDSTTQSSGVNTTNPVFTGDATISGLTVGKGGGAVSSNTAVGASALAVNTSGANNTGIGNNALLSNTTGNRNSSVGRSALGSITTASDNSALGYFALQSNSTGANNTAVGVSALQENTTASNNTAVGYQAGYSNTTGVQSAALGNASLYANTTGDNNTAIGHQSLDANTTGSNNTAVGVNALGAQTTGSSNTAIGVGAGGTITTGAKNTIIGRYDGNQGGLDIRTASNYIVLSDGDGNPRMFYDGVNNYWRAQAIYDRTGGASANVVVDASGFLYRSTSSLKYKKDIQDLTHGLAKVMQLRPVTYKSKSTQDGNTVFGGLIAEEVDALGLNEFVQYAGDGSPDAISYANMVSLAFKAIQELNAKVDAQAAEIAELKAR